MYLSTECISCKEDVRIKSSELTRPDLAHKTGEEFRVVCDHCHKKFTTHVNDVTAYPSDGFKLFCIGLGVLLTALFFAFGFIAMISYVIPVMIWKYGTGKSDTFNSYKIPRNY